MSRFQSKKNNDRTHYQHIVQDQPIVQEKTISSLIQSLDLYRLLNDITQINHYLQKKLSDPLNQATLINIRDGIATFSASSSSLATHIQFAKADLIHILNQNPNIQKTIHTIKIKIAVDEYQYHHNND